MSRCKCGEPSRNAGWNLSGCEDYRELKAENQRLRDENKLQRGVMHQIVVQNIVKNCRSRAAEGDCPTTPGFHRETLEETIIALADQVSQLKTSPFGRMHKLLDGISDIDNDPEVPIPADAINDLCDAAELLLSAINSTTGNYSPDLETNLIVAIERVRSKGI